MLQVAPTRQLNRRPAAASIIHMPSPPAARAAGAEDEMGKMDDVEDGAASWPQTSALGAGALGAGALGAGALGAGALGAGALGAGSPDAGERAAELAHDARNFLAAVNLCCDLLGAPGVLAPRFRHYAADLRQIGRTGARLIEELAADLTARCSEVSASAREAVVLEWMPPSRSLPAIEDLADELLALESPLQALAGIDVRLEMECSTCSGQLGLNSEALVRILFNLVANAVEAMERKSPSTPERRKFIRIAARAGHIASACPSPETVVLSIRDNGPGIAPGDLPRIFDPGFSTRAKDESEHEDESSRLAWETAGAARPSGHGLPIVRRLVESAGGTIRAVSSYGCGARFDIELPFVPVPGPRFENLRSTGGGSLPDAVATKTFEFSTTAQESGV